MPAEGWVGEAGSSRTDGSESRFELITLVDDLGGEGLARVQMTE